MLVSLFTSKAYFILDPLIANNSFISIPTVSIGIMPIVEVGTHELRRIEQNICTSQGQVHLGPYYKCTKCNQTNSDTSPSAWDESCREYLQRQEEYSHWSTTNPARQSYLRNISFRELTEGCSDPIDFLERRSVTVDTTHGRVPREWEEMEPDPVEPPQNSFLSTVISYLSA